MELKYGSKLKLDIAVGKSRRETSWKNIQITWGELINKLSTTQRTHETMQAFLAMKKDDQDNIKDIGGFVGGSLKDGRRKNGYVNNRSLITLDADSAPADLWDDIKLLASYSMCVYSTHKHTPKAPRLRIVIPLSRKVSPDEYEAIARKIAEEYGMDYFDDTTYEPARLMFWPSTPKDGDYLFDVIDAPILNPDNILAKYEDWKDTSFWPESSRCHQTRKRSADKQGDPLAKEGLIGAFCRTYTIQDAIEKFIPDVYKECNTADRYTYVHGSTNGGLVIYEDKFAYSNHGTDPISGQLCNAFDLVRIHKFGELDIDAKDNTPSTRMPSYLKMIELVGNDDETKVTIGTEALALAKQEFGQVDTDDDEPQEQAEPTKEAKDDKEWIKKLSTSKTGKFEATIDNMLLILEHDPNLKGIGKHDLFTDRFIVNKKLPWKRSGKYWTDLDDASLRHYMETVYQIEGRQKLIDALAMAFEKKAYHPVKQFIESVEWDNKPRLETVLIDYLGAEDNIYVRTVTRKALVAAVARIYNPGCKFDYMLTLVGKQGIGKSLLINKLAGEWFSDTLPDIKGKEAYEALDGVWIMEMGELAALKKSERESIKSYLSKQEDSYRKAYARNVTINKRQCIFVGTTNDEEFLNDPTGNRRFWIVEVDGTLRTKTIWNDLTQEVVNQIWAEALVLYKAGENIMELSNEVADMTLSKQREHSEQNSYYGIIAEYLEKPIPENWYKMTLSEQLNWNNISTDFEPGEEVKLVPRTKVCAMELWICALDGTKLNFQNATARKINECMSLMPNWKKDDGRDYGPFGKQRGYAKED